MFSITDFLMSNKYRDYQRQGYIWISPKAEEELMDLVGEKKEMYKIGAVLEMINSLLSSPLHLEGMIDDCLLSISPVKGGDLMEVSLIIEEGECFQNLLTTKFPYALTDSIKLRLYNPRSDKSSKKRLEDLEKDKTWLLLQSVS